MQEILIEFVVFKCIALLKKKLSLKKQYVRNKVQLDLYKIIEKNVLFCGANLYYSTVNKYKMHNFTKNSLYIQLIIQRIF